ncbi:MFS transporter [Steroidobacter sp.]|uniref:MFS transporter n=1 Tax=Steroidobacter sp. TaxID=1978227 RepID=UPI001A43B10F|nr:MFS transporter [Steroidobacter sp.]MBL8267621.1 MFS transporter [Steroidobacter sp.]
MATWGRRHTVLAFCLAGLVLAYTDRVNLAVASVAMGEQFGWSQTVKGFVLSSFFVGYLLFMIPSGALAARYGGKRVLAMAVVWWSAFTLLTPLAASVSLTTLILVRIALGLGEAAVLPAAYDLFSRWVPAQERGRAMAWFLSGTPLGQVIGLAGSGWLTAQMGWPSSFYMFGALGFVWVACWLARVANAPADDRAMAIHERELLAAGTAASRSDASPATPWQRLLSHPALWAIVVAIFCGNWALYMLLGWLPSYFREVHGLGIAGSGLYSAAPWVASFLGMQAAGLASDAAISRGVRTIAVRKFMTATSLLGTGSCLLLLQQTNSANVALALICMATMLGGAGVAGAYAGPLDIAPRHAGVLIGFVNTIGTLPGVAGITITGWLVDRTHSYATAFLVAAILGLCGTVYYLRYASAEPLEH